MKNRAGPAVCPQLRRAHWRSLPATMACPRSHATGPMIGRSLPAPTGNTALEQGGSPRNSSCGPRPHPTSGRSLFPAGLCGFLSNPSPSPDVHPHSHPESSPPSSTRTPQMLLEQSHLPCLTPPPPPPVDPQRPATRTPSLESSPLAPLTSGLAHRCSA